MAQAQTQRFGAIEYDPGAEIVFPIGLPGFHHERRFLLVERTALAPILFMQSLDTPDLCFAALPATAIEAAYELQLNGEDQATLLEEGQPGTPLLSLAILTTAEGGHLTANLLAPVVINLARNVGLQAVRNDARYSHCHPLGEGSICS